jgi:hypothetical protein
VVRGGGGRDLFAYCSHRLGGYMHTRTVPISHKHIRLPLFSVSLSWTLRTCCTEHSHRRPIRLSGAVIKGKARVCLQNF